jgi:NADH-quinone oxidoreductase subunit M
MVCLFRRNDYHLGRLLHVENVPASNAGNKTFKDVNFEGFALVVIIAVLFFFGMYPKPITDLITPSLENIFHINRIN